MARYYFDVDDGQALTVDLDGIECGSMDELRFAAIDGLPDLARIKCPTAITRRWGSKCATPTGTICSRRRLRSASNGLEARRSVVNVAKPVL